MKTYLVIICKLFLVLSSLTIGFSASADITNRQKMNCAAQSLQKIMGSNWIVRPELVFLSKTHFMSYYTSVAAVPLSDLEFDMNRVDFIAYVANKDLNEEKAIYMGSVILISELDRSSQVNDDSAQSVHVDMKEDMKRFQKPLSTFQGNNSSTVLTDGQNHKNYRCTLVNSQMAAPNTKQENIKIENLNLTISN